MVADRTEVKRGKHKSLENKVRPECAWIEGLPHVSAVIVTRSEACRHKFAPGTIRVKGEVAAGLKLTAYGGFGITDLYVYVNPTSEIATVRAAIESRHA